MLGRIFNSEQSLTPADDLIIFLSLHLEMLERRKEIYPTIHLPGSEPELAARIFIVFQWFLLFFEGLFHSLAGRTCTYAQILLPSAECVALLWRQLENAWSLGHAEKEK